MKMFERIISIIAVIAIAAAMTVGFAACNKSVEGLRFAAPEGTPVLAVARLGGSIGGKNVNYTIVSASNIAAEMGSEKADIVIMPVNGGANLIRQNFAAKGVANYKLVSVAVDGSLFMVGRKDGGGELTFDDIKGKKIACIGKAGVPGLVFRYVMANNGIELISSGTPAENQAYVEYVADGAAARQRLAANDVDLAVVGEPAATQFKNISALSLNAEMDMQAAYSKVNPEENGESYPQAGLFVRASLAEDRKFMSALFDALAKSKEWVVSNPADVQAFMKENLYEAAVFPEDSISRCAINAGRIDSQEQNRIVVFLKNVMPKDSSGNAIDWDAAREIIF